MLLLVGQFSVLRIGFEELEGSLRGAEVLKLGLPDEGVSRVAAGDGNQTFTSWQNSTMLQCRKLFF